MRSANANPLRRRVFEAAAVVALMFVGTGPFEANAQAPSASSEVPDLSGIWKRAERREVLTPLRLNARAEALRGVLDERAYPKYDCVAATMPRIVTDSYNFQIQQQADRVLLMFEKDDVVRTVWLEGYGHPVPSVGEYFLQGYSIGRYEGAELVVETTKFTYDPHGFSDGSPTIASSQRKTVSERYWLDEGRLRVEVVTEDPLMILEPNRFRYAWDRTDEEWLEFACDIENSHTVLPFLTPQYGVP
jgi:hypothetical protein